MDGLANSFRGKEENDPAPPTNNPHKIHKVEEDSGDFLLKYPNITSYCILGLWIIALFLASFPLSSPSTHEVPAIRGQSFHTGMKHEPQSIPLPTAIFPNCNFSHSLQAAYRKQNKTNPKIPALLIILTICQLLRF